MERLPHSELRIEMPTLYSSDGMMQRVDEIEFKHDLYHQLIYMLDGAVIMDIRTTELDVFSIKTSSSRPQQQNPVRL